MTLEIEIDDGPFTLLLMLKSYWWVGVPWIIMSALVLF